MPIYLDDIENVFSFTSSQNPTFCGFRGGGFLQINGLQIGIPLEASVLGGSLSETYKWFGSKRWPTDGPRFFSILPSIGHLG